MLEATFRELFRYLEGEGYAWRALSPDRVRKLRGSAEIDPLALFFGLGRGERPPGLENLRGLRPAVSRVGERLVAHDHWDAGGEIAYLSAESYDLLDRLPPCAGRRVLDLGSGAGGLSLALASSAREVVGVEINPRAVEWARASATAQGILNIRFETGRIPDFPAGGGFDLAVFNPPMAIPDPATPRPHRDGGKLGCELPGVFLEFARAQLRPGGEACFLATSPVVGGRSIFRERLCSDPRWSLVGEECLHPRFNQALARKAGYARLGVERVELWFFHLSKAYGGGRG